MSKRKNNSIVWTLLWCTIAFFMGMAFLFLLNNFSTEGIYKFVSCTYNQHECDNACWDGVCTDEIIDECCVDIRYCEGGVDAEWECLDRYCVEEGKTCVAQFNIDRLECGCEKII